MGVSPRSPFPSFPKTSPGSPFQLNLRTPTMGGGGGQLESRDGGTEIFRSRPL